MRTKNAFRERLNELLVEYQSGPEKKSMKDFATEILHISRQSAGYYLNGERVPDIDTFREICKECNVSADWLLGLSDVRTTEKSIQTACATFNLSEDTGRMVQKFSTSLSYLMQSESEEEWKTIQHAIEMLIYCIQTCGDFPEDGNIHRGENGVTMPTERFASYIAVLIGQKITDSIIKNLKEVFCSGQS